MRIGFTGIALLAGALVLATPSGPSLAAQPAGATATVPKSKALKPGEKVTFLELGSVGCKPCEAMKPVMQAVRDKYGNQVEVTFHDVRRNPSIGREWSIRLIPTQIFLDPAGKEVFRHEGFFALKEVDKVLQQMGLR
ncbi:MAG: thioredoxin family protein [Deltaproteobacteria bacterium]|nr:thioredoxin family protein [Deltaproteobacteria bacterium]